MGAPNEKCFSKERYGRVLIGGVCNYPVVVRKHPFVLVAQRGGFPLGGENKKGGASIACRLNDALFFFKERRCGGGERENTTMFVSLPLTVAGGEVASSTRSRPSA